MVPYLLVSKTKNGVLPKTKNGVLEREGGGKVDARLALRIRRRDLLQLAHKHIHALVRQLRI